MGIRGVFQPTVTYFLVIHIVPYTKVSKEGTDQLCLRFVGLNDFFKNPHPFLVKFCSQMPVVSYVYLEYSVSIQLWKVDAMY